jgi:hypothetical protein
MCLGLCKWVVQESFFLRYIIKIIKVSTIDSCYSIRKKSLDESLTDSQKTKSKDNNVISVYRTKSFSIEVLKNNSDD